MKKKAQRKNYCTESLSFKINSSHEIYKSKVHNYKFYSSMKMEQKICKQADKLRYSECNMQGKKELLG